MIITSICGIGRKISAFRLDVVDHANMGSIYHYHWSINTCCDRLCCNVFFKLCVATLRLEESQILQIYPHYGNRLSIRQAKFKGTKFRKQNECIITARDKEINAVWFPVLTSSEMHSIYAEGAVLGYCGQCSIALRTNQTGFEPNIYASLI